MTLSDYQTSFLEFLFGQVGSVSAARMDVYRSSVHGKAMRAARLHFPTVKALLGLATFEALVRYYLSASKKDSGDWSDFGWGFEEWIHHHGLHSHLPYLSCVARLDSAVKRVEQSQHDELDISSFTGIGDDMHRCTLVVNQGVVLLRSAYPIVSIWEAHQSPLPEKTPSFTEAKKLLAQGSGQSALVYRSGWRVLVQELREKDMAWLESFKAQRSVADALGGSTLVETHFAGWLQDMVARKIVVGARLIN